MTKKKEDKQPDNTSSFEYFEWLRKENIRQLRKAGHKAAKIGSEPRKRKRFVKRDDSQIRELNQDTDYIKWREMHSDESEPLEANADSWEDDLNNTVD